ncbi:hypothetical protein BDQ12DRAFT_679886 [Crucibulum laeve]|uniref:Septation initiation network scaffold protein cdc11 n=1 Tax=Crucibulum laeve TaxID=68775 RepID=A0A5C3M5K4_9AGAR|nr:hypothetical protein BDQ12DRAFT_679886 [Crucibulum laeve]
MSQAQVQAVPGWQTEELQDEWVDLEPEEDSADDDHNLTYGTRSISLTAPLTTHIHTNSDYASDASPSSDSSRAVGTFVVRDNVQNAPLLPKTPGRNKNAFVKDFFTPLPLERMFEPPSPPKLTAPASQLEISPSSSPSLPHTPRDSTTEDEIIETDMPNMNSFHGRKASLACQFTFSIPRETSSLRPNDDGSYPQAQSTPNPPFVPHSAAPPTDPRLRLFQFQYDTYTRDHLSAMVDSIAVNTPSGSGTTPSPTSFTNGLSRVSEASVPHASHLRSTKRLKLSPASDFYGEGAGAGASIARPKLYGKDYVGESRSLMQQIKQARDFSTISTVASAQEEDSNFSRDSSVRNAPSSRHQQPITTRRSSFLSIPSNHNPSESSGSMSSKGGSYSSSTYRQQAAALMAQIKSDMKGQKRLFSGETDLTHTTEHSHSFSTAVTSHDARRASEIKVTDTRSGHSRTSSIRSASSRHKASPRKSQRSASATHAVVEDLSSNVSRLSIRERQVSIEAPHQILASSQRSQPSQDPSSSPPPSTLAPPSYPSSSVRAHTNEDLNRFVSSSTASGTTLTSGSAPSFVKHPGPAHIRTIAPGDIPPLPDRLGDMMFDKVMMKWVKNTAEATRGQDKSEVSEDPFGDIESLRDDSRGGEEVVQELFESSPSPEPLGEMSRIEEQSEVDDEEEMELTSFSTDASAHMVTVMTGIDSHGVEDDGETTDSQDGDDMDHTITQSDVHEVDYDTEEEHAEAMLRSLAPPPSSVRHLSTPSRTSSLPNAATPTVRSVLKSHSATPTSVLKAGVRQRYQTPVHRGHRRSVSFSDGKREGPIRGLNGSTTDGEVSRTSVESSNVLANTSNGVVQSVRSKRIAEMMNALEDSEFQEDSPSKASSLGRPEQLRPLSSRQQTPGASGSNSSRRVFSRSHTHRPSSANMSRANGTFLTECSFGITHDRLVEVITDVQPFEPYWEELSTIDLSKKRLESVARLKEFLPRLDTLHLNSNQLSWLSGVPGTVRTLSVAFNSLSGVTSYSHLLNLENLDISHNDVDSLRQLDCLRRLRELKADGNKITSTDGLQRMEGLVKLSLQGNSIHSVDLARYQWTRLEMLNVSQNRIDNIRGIASLQSLIALNLDNNSLSELEFERAMPKLRILRVSGNRLHQLQVGGVPNLRTLYADNNALYSLAKVDHLTKLENLSLRNQSGRGLNLLTRDVRDVKRLYLSGNPLKTKFLDEPCYNLVYLELAACRLTALPEGMSVLVPNLRVLNLNYNFLEDARPLEGLTRLQKLTIIGSRLKNTKPLIRLLQRMPDVEMLDFRMNPCTLGWYLPLLVKDVPGALQPSEGGRGEGKRERSAGDGWQELDSKFRRDLPDESYIGRLAYRGLIMRACPRIRMLDGVGVSEKERTKAHQLLEGLLGKSKKSGIILEKGTEKAGGGG